MNYNKYRPSAQQKRTARPPHISVSPAGLISINRSAYLEHLKGATHVELFYDSDASKIGLRPKKYKTKDGLKLTIVGKQKTSYRINGKPFFKAFGIALDSSRKGTPVWDKDSELLAVKI